MGESSAKRWNSDPTKATYMTKHLLNMQWGRLSIHEVLCGKSSKTSSSGSAIDVAPPSHVSCLNLRDKGTPNPTLLITRKLSFIVSSVKLLIARRLAGVSAVHFSSIAVPVIKVSFQTSRLLASVKDGEITLRWRRHVEPSELAMFELKRSCDGFELVSLGNSERRVTI